MSALSFFDNIAAARMLALLNMPFKMWDGYAKGIIDEKGEVINKKLASSDDNWTALHRVIRRVKVHLDKIPGVRLAATLSMLREEAESEGTLELLEAVLSGAGVDVAAGTNTGAVVHGTPKRKKVESFEEYLNESKAATAFINKIKGLKGKTLSKSEGDAITKEFASIVGSGLVSEKLVNEIESVLVQIL